MPDLNSWPTPRLLSTAARLVEHVWNEKLADLGLTHAGVIALEVLETEGPMAQTLLAARARVQAQTMGKTLSRLEAHGHINRARSQADRRAHRVSISESGKVALAQARELERSLAADTEQATDELQELLRGIIRRLGSSRWSLAGPPPAGWTGQD
ncbi:MarR family winged helix-turn-helix transcriptional regulator [Arthrobacter mobilis]|uniref:MarR family winged helix-turn-helix transcriptional regulator n=1 Tax=Arthrobacter mobilis TaxID=2724944 RepID=UPI0028AFFC5A|nr:MarR family transcriptional regulator [Arthrobacter mobilis]